MRSPKQPVQTKSAKGYAFLYKALIAALISISFSSCTSEPEITNATQERKKNLVIDFVDPSGTAIGAGWPNPPKQFYTDQIAWLENNGGGQLVVYNTSLKIPQELTVEINSLLKVPNAIDVGEEKVKGIMLLNDSFALSNSKATEIFLAQLDSFIIKFDPVNAPGGDLSYININLHSVNKKLTEPAFAQYNRDVFIYSDLQDEPGGRIKQPADSSLIEKLNQSANDIAACYLLPQGNENTAIKQLKAVPLSSYSDYVSHLNSLSPIKQLK